MVIGSSGDFGSSLPPEECARRLNADSTEDRYIGFADGSGFQLAPYGRTAVRIRGEFKPETGWTEVSYHIEFLPTITLLLGVSFAVGLVLLLAMVSLHYIPASTFLLLFVIVAVVLPLNLWLSEQQATRLKAYVASTLGASVGGD